MVKIINGEIVADNDPRLRSPPPPASGPSREGHGNPAVLRPWPPAGAAGGGGGGGTGFNLNAPPLKFVTPAPGSQPLFGLPDMEIFGVLVTPYAVLAAAALGMMMGWRGVLVALILYYVYLSSQDRTAEQGQRPPGGQQQQQQQQQGAGGGPMDFLQNYLNGPQPRSRPGGAGGPPGAGAQEGPRDQRLGGGEAPASERGGGGAGGAGGWAAFQGKGNKLGGGAK